MDEFTILSIFVRVSARGKGEKRERVSKEELADELRLAWVKGENTAK